jgi:hypothetical protein
MGGLVSFNGDDPFVKSGNLTSGTMEICLKGGCHYGKRNREVVQ